MGDPKKEQIEISERLQLLLLQDFEAQLRAKTISPTDRATLVRLLSTNGWTIDPAQLPKGLRGVLTKDVDASKFDDDDPDISTPVN